MKNHFEKLRELQRQLKDLDIEQLANTLKELKHQIDVLVEGVEALEKDKSNVVTGEFLNQVIVNTSRFLPRETLVSLIEKQFKGLDSNK